MSWTVAFLTAFGLAAAACLVVLCFYAIWASGGMAVYTIVVVLSAVACLAALIKRASE